MLNWLLKKDRRSIDGFQEIYDSNIKYVYSFVLARTGGDEKIAEDIVQETFLSAWRVSESFSHKSSYRTWLCGIAKNKLYEYYRKQISTYDKEVPCTEDLNQIPADFDMEVIAVKNETRSLVINTLKEINPLYRNCLTLKYIDNYTLKEISKILGKTPKAVDGILQRAKKNFIAEYLKAIEKEKNHE